MAGEVALPVQADLRTVPEIPGEHDRAVQGWAALEHPQALHDDLVDHAAGTVAIPVAEDLGTALHLDPIPPAREAEAAPVPGQHHQLVTLGLAAPGRDERDDQGVAHAAPEAEARAAAVLGGSGWRRLHLAGGRLVEMHGVERPAAGEQPPSRQVAPGMRARGEATAAGAFRGAAGLLE